ncbi:hypothetical protein KR067_007854, partial [Drosophila pandora]
SSITPEAASTNLPSSEDEEDIGDDDTCSAQQLAKEFRNFRPKDESGVSLQRDYVLCLDADWGFSRIAAGLSSSAVHIFNLDANGGGRLEKFCFLPPSDTKTSSICGVRFLDEGPDNVLVGSTNGYVLLYDLRVKGEQARFRHTEKDKGQLPVSKSITCFDRNANGRIICSGTEQYMSNVHLLFFDVRERSFMGVYNESHEDDITSVRFHDRNPDLLVTGSSDGLVNLFDVKESDEDEALLNTINTESSVGRLQWHRNVYEKDMVSCITHQHEFKIYECQEGDEVFSLERSDITAAIRRKNPANCTPINAHNQEDGGLFLLAGTNFNRGEVLRSFNVASKTKLEPLANYLGNKQIVRDSVFDAKRGLLVTGGESGIVTVWAEQDSSEASGSEKLKIKSEKKNRKKTPY